MGVDKEDVTVVIPTLNEEEAIGSVVDELREEGYENVLVVDGRSEDRTVEISRERGADVVYQEGSGKANAVKTAIETVRTPYLVLMDGDWTYPAREIDSLLEEGEEHDHVVGRRRGRENIPRLHRLGNFGIRTVFNLLMDTDLEDPLSGMYLLRTEAARSLEFPFEGFECEVTICAQLRGDSIEVPIDYRERVGEKELSGVPELARILFASFLLAEDYADPSLTARVVGLTTAILGVGTALFLAAHTYL